MILNDDDNNDTDNDDNNNNLNNSNHQNITLKLLSRSQACIPTNVGRMSLEISRVCIPKTSASISLKCAFSISRLNCLGEAQLR